MYQKTNEVRGTVEIFQAFDMENFFDKEGLIDILYCMYTKGKISAKDYIMWFRASRAVQSKNRIQTFE